MKKLFTSMMLLLFVACSGGSGPTKTESFLNLLNNHYGYVGQNNFVVVKGLYETASEGFAVVYDWDLGTYVAYDLKDYRVGDSWSTYVAHADFRPVYIHDTYIDTWGETFYIGDAYDFWGFYQGEFVFEEGAEGSKDLEKVAAVMESYKVAKVGEAMSAEFGLSEERGIEIAKVASQMQKLAKKRGLTEADANAFSKELLGVDLKKAESAFLKKAAGENEEFEKLLESAAQANEISPEHMNKIINDIFLKG